MMEVDVPRKRIALSMKSDPFNEGGPKPKETPKVTQSPLPKGKPELKTQKKEETIEDKLALLRDKFKR